MENIVIGQDIKEFLLINDAIIDFELTANRPDCRSMIGIAREAAVTIGEKLNYPEIEVKACDEDIDFEVIGEMRELIKERWKNYGIKLINYNLIIDLKEDDKESSVEINPDIISDDDENNIENEDEYFEYLNSNKNNNDEGESEDEEVESEGIKEFIPIMLTISMGIGVGKIIFSKY